MRIGRDKWIIKEAEPDILWNCLSSMQNGHIREKKFEGNWRRHEIAVVQLTV